MCHSVSGTQLPQKMVLSLWDQDEQVRRTHKCMGKICASLLNCQTLRIFQYGGHFGQNVRVSKNLTPAVNRQPGFRRQDS